MKEDHQKSEADENNQCHKQDSSHHGEVILKKKTHIAVLINPNSDKHQISPCHINAYLPPEVMRIKDMITQGEFS